MDTSFTTAEEARVIIESLQQEVYVLRLQLIKANAALVKGVNVNDLPRSQDCVEKEDFKFTQISRAVEVFKEGKFLIVLDNENRENEGDLIIAAGAMNSDKMAFMINNTRFLP
jgi:protein-disulfide isomerase